jgi:molybdopterin synthase catalytic subunit
LFCDYQTTMEKMNENSNNSDDSTNQSYIDDDYMIGISSVLPSLQQCYEFVAAEPSCGAVSTFVGITRNNFQNKQVLALSYEAYIPMAMKELLKLCNECKTMKYTSIRRIAAVHIIGDCPVGYASVILACSSPHRIEAIQCCEYLINQLKARIPIWKKEIYANEPNAIWKENIEWVQPHQQSQPQPQEEPTNQNATTTTSSSSSSTTEPQSSLELQSRRIMVRQTDNNTNE